MQNGFKLCDKGDDVADPALSLAGFKGEVSH